MTIEIVATGFDIFKDGSPSHIRIAWRDRDQWAVLDGRMCLSRSGRWHHEPLPSSRTDGWKREHRFTLKDAKLLAAAAAQDLPGQRTVLDRALKGLGL